MVMVYLLHQLVTESAMRHPDREAVRFQGGSVTYAELESESGRLARVLYEMGVKRGDRVGIHLNRSIHSVVGALGILKAGAAYVPIDPMAPAGRIDYIVNRCGIRHLVTSQKRLGALEGVFPSGGPLQGVFVMDGRDSRPQTFGSAARVDWEGVRDGIPDGIPNGASLDADLAYILFTSGSTGNPKGVMITHRNSLTFVDTAHAFFGMNKEDRFSNICPLHFDMSVFDLYVAFEAGASVDIIPESAAIFPTRLAETIEKNRITVWNSVPSALSLLANYGNLQQHDLSGLRLILFAGEVFPVKYLRRLKECIPAARFCNMYGQTEANTSTYYWVEKVPSDDRQALPIGKSLPNFEVFALDGDGRKIEGPGQEGELFVRASSVALGYWGDEEKTRQNFVRNPLLPDLNETVYRTGDLVRLDADGNYVFLGRKDHMIKSRGYRIEIGEIEAVLQDHPGVRQAVVVPIPDDLIGNRISVLIVPAARDGLEKEEILAYCSRHLPKYMIPEIVEFRDRLPTTSSGKVDRKKLAADGP
jgi:amino acid adenylation domain-containing protein